MQNHVYDAIVVGAGQAGIAVSCHLKRLGIDHLLLDRGHPGETWRTQRWDSFVLNTPNSLNRLPCGSMNPGNPNEFPSKYEVVDFFESQVLEQRLPFVQNTEVSGVRRSAVNGHFEIETFEAVLHASNVVVASGALNIPKLPTVAAYCPAEILSLHSSEYKKAEQLPEGAVLVVGSGKSGSQIAEDLLESNRNVYLATSKAGRARRRFRGIDAFECMRIMGYLDQTRDDLDYMGTQFTTLPVFTGADGGHTLSIQRLWRRGAVLLGRLEAFSGRNASFKNNLRENIEFGDEMSAVFLSKIESTLAELAPDAPPLECDADDEPDAEALNLSSPSEINLVEAGISTIIWSTGFRGDYSWLQVEGAVGEDGAPVHEGGISEADGIYFIGLPWLRTRGSSSMFGVNADSRVIAESVAGRVSRNGS